MKKSNDHLPAEIPDQLLSEVPARIALRYSVLPVAKENGSLKVAVPENLSAQAKEELRIVLGKDLELIPVSKLELEALISRLYGVGAETIELLAGEREEASDAQDFELIDPDQKEKATIIRLVNELLMDALKHRASDIHIEPFEKTFRIRYRVDGLLQEPRVSEKIRLLAPSLISRIKIMSQLDISEKRLPQDGRIKIKQGRTEIDLRVSVLPSSSGEAVVIRILKPLELLELKDLGFSEETVTQIKTLLRRPHGMILVTGPTGSGKTTTLYACLKELNTLERKIITIEDPIEYKLPGIIQMQANPKIGFTFAKALRSMLRHDPDCLMVGEIRDQETAEIAIRAALTGHLVLSTLHTNDAASAVTRLLEMGIEAYLVSASVAAVLAQRLVRKLHPPCAECQHTGFFGRTVIYELMPISESIRFLISEGNSSAPIRNQALQEGMIRIEDEGLKKVEEKMTSQEELQRVIFISPST